MRQRPFQQLDVFTAQAYLGNPLAMVLDGAGLDDAAMQGFARWTNLSETTFVLPPTQAGADYRVRIFTPGGELPFAGHPTLGTCHAWLQAGGQPQTQGCVVQECAVGLVRVQQMESGRLAFAAPALKRSEVEPGLLAHVRQALSLSAAQVLAAQWLDNGPRWLGLWLDSPETVLQLAPDNAQLKALNVKVGVAAPYARADEAPPLIGRRNREAQAFGQSEAAVLQGELPDLEVRAFAPSMGIDEDPVTGSLNASLAQWLMAEGWMPERYLASQGVCLGRSGMVHLSRDGQGQVWVGGDSVVCISGTVLL